MFTFRYLWVGLLSLVLASCVPSRLSVTDDLPPLRPLTFELVPGQSVVERFDPPGAGAQVELIIAAQVRNPNPVGLTLKRIAYEVALEGEAVGRGEIAPQVFVAPDAQAPLRFTLSVSLEDRSDLIRAVAGAFTDAPLQFDISGITVLEVQGREANTRSARLFAGEMMAREVVEPPQLRLDEAASGVFYLRPDAPVVRAVLSAVNPGGIGYFIYAQDLELELGGVPLTSQDVAPLPVAAGQESSFELLFYPQPGEFGPEAQTRFSAALEGIPTLLELRGDLLLDVLGVDTFEVENGWGVTGFVFTRSP